MTRWIHGIGLFVFVASLGSASASSLSADGAARAAAPYTPGKLVGTLKTEVPSRPCFVLHGTMPVAPRPFRRFPCPYVVVDPDGTPLSTQWELVAQARDHTIVEILAVVDNRWTGEQVFTVHEGTSSLSVSRFDRSTVAALLTPGALELALEDQTGKVYRLSLSGPPQVIEFTRFGSATATLYRALRGGFGDVQAWMTVRAGSKEIELILNWHAGGLPARPDVYFRSLALSVPAGTVWTPLLPDPAISYPLLVTRGNHIVPQRMERSFRIIVHGAGQTPDLTLRGWAVGDWSKGGYMPQAIGLPSLNHVPVDLTTQKLDDFARLAQNLPTQPGSTPVSALYPAQGVFYGGMTGGVEIEQFPFVPLAVTGQPDGLLSAYVEQLRYASRQLGCIYEPDGQPIALDDYLNADGTTPWSMFNNVFQVFQQVVQDAPFDFSKTGPGVGQAAYDPLVFQPIDGQHYVRRTKANKALAWLDNDPLAKLYLLMDAELARMTYYEGPGGRLQVPAAPGLGTSMGRAQAWAGDVMATAHAVADPAWRARNEAWFETFVQALATAQMPNKLFSALSTGKSAKDPPYGNGQTASYWIHRSNEQLFLMLALRGIDRTVGIDCSDLIRTAGEGLWSFAWKVGTNGPLDRYPAGPIGGPRYATRSEIPAGLTSTVPHDSFHVGTALALAQVEGANMVPALLAYSGAPDVGTALAVFESWGLQNIANRANTLALLQNVVP